MCPPVEHIANGVVKASNSQYAVGDTLKVTCNRGYELGGSDTVTCLSTNEWSAFPICRSTGEFTYTHAQMVSRSDLCFHSLI